MSGNLAWVSRLYIFCPWAQNVGLWWACICIMEGGHFSFLHADPGTVGLAFKFVVAVFIYYHVSAEDR